MDSSDDSCNPDDEVHEIRRAMRVAKARKRSLAHQIKSRVDRNSADKCELESVLRNQSSELARTKTLLSQAEFELKEARFEINQFGDREGKLKDERRGVENRSREMLADLQVQVQESKRFTEDRSAIALFECDKLAKTLSALYKSVVGGSTGAPKTTRQLLDKALQDTAQLRAFLASKGAVLLEEPTLGPGLRGRGDANSCDNALLDMCRSLEEENKALSDTVDTLRTQVAQGARDASVSRLIPHYRLAIVRSRTYAANLLEQLRREQAAAQALREQLDVTYVDLKKVVEEKRRLYQRMTRYSLQLEQRDTFQSQARTVDEAYILGGREQNQGGQREQREQGNQRGQGGQERGGYREQGKQGQGGYRERGGQEHRGRSRSPSRDAGREVGESKAQGGGGGLYGYEGFEGFEGYEGQGMGQGGQGVHSSAGTPPTQDVFRGTGEQDVFRGTRERDDTSTYLKSELVQLDTEIDQLKEQLQQAAMLRSQRILSEVFDAYPIDTTDHPQPQPDPQPYL